MKDFFHGIMVIAIVLIFILCFYVGILFLTFGPIEAGSHIVNIFRPPTATATPDAAHPTPTRDPFFYVKIVKQWSELHDKSTDHYVTTKHNHGYWVSKAEIWGVLLPDHCYKVELDYQEKFIAGLAYEVQCPAVFSDDYRWR